MIRSFTCFVVTAMLALPTGVSGYTPVFEVRFVPETEPPLVTELESYMQDLILNALPLTRDAVQPGPSGTAAPQPAFSLESELLVVAFPQTAEIFRHKEALQVRTFSTGFRPQF